ncbi:MAG: ankyrin repeat domain-containing protein [Alphaproteobacteria bacterium]|nr:ankyrin repeat domain-containing protein [Alphaproteobacteria bacterium]
MKQIFLVLAALLTTFDASATTQDLIDSVKNNDVAAVLKLLESGENVNGTTEQGNTALHYAIATDNAELSQLLLAYGADLNAINGKGWSPLKIAQTKQLKNVAPILAQAQQGKVDLPPSVVKIKENLVDSAKNETKTTEENMFPIVEDEKEVETVKTEAKSITSAPVNTSSEINTPKTDVVTTEKISVETTSSAVSEDTVQEQTADTSVEVVKIAELLASQAIAQANQEVAHAREEQANAEAKVKALEAQLKEMQEEKMRKEAIEKAKIEAEAKAKAEAEAKAKEEAEAKAKAEAEAKAKVEAEAKAQAAEKAKKIAQMAKKMPAPKPFPKMQFSALTDKIYAGDEEVVYCLNYLGQGENQNMLRAAGFYAASSGISEERYKQITALSNDFFATAVNDELKKRNAECGQIITPKDINRQNRIIRSLNQSVGY